MKQPLRLVIALFAIGTVRAGYELVMASRSYSASNLRAASERIPNHAGLEGIGPWRQ